jgi:NitT/TauT family transport system substrate-binding protein
MQTVPNVKFLFILLFCAVSITVFSVGHTQGQKLEKVMIGSSPVLSSSGIFIAMERGYFAEEGIQADTTTFAKSGVAMLPSLIKGDLDVGGGNINAGLYNAYNDGHKIQIVADKGTVSKGCGYLALIAAKKNVPDGDVSKFKIKKGFNMALTAKGVSQEIVTERWARRFGLELSDINIKTMPYSAFVPALDNGSLDAAVEIEPHVARAVQMGAAIRIAGDDEVYPDQQSATIFYSENFANNKPELAQKWMNAYLRGLRDYNDAFFHGKDFDEIVRILIKWTKVKDPVLYQKTVPTGLSPDGGMNLDSLKADAQWFHDHGYIKKPVDMGIVNTTWIENAKKKLGPYTPPKK